MKQQCNAYVRRCVWLTYYNICIIFAASSSSSSANDFSAKLSYEKGGVREPKSLRLIHLTAVTFNPSTKAPISALDFVLYLHLLTDYFSI